MRKMITATNTTNQTIPATANAGASVYIPVNKITSVVEDPYTGGCMIYTDTTVFRVNEYTHMVLGAMDQTIVDVNDYDEYVI